MDASGVGEDTWHGCPNADGCKKLAPVAVIAAIFSTCFSVPLLYYGDKYKPIEDTIFCPNKIATWAIIMGAFIVGSTLLFTTCNTVAAVALAQGKVPLTAWLRSAIAAFSIAWIICTCSVPIEFDVSLIGSDGAVLNFTSDGKKCRDVADPLWKLNTVCISFGLLGSITSLAAVCSPCIAKAAGGSL